MNLSRSGLGQMVARIAIRDSSSLALLPRSEDDDRADDREENLCISREEAFLGFCCSPVVANVGIIDMTKHVVSRGGHFDAHSPRKIIYCTGPKNRFYCPGYFTNVVSVTITITARVVSRWLVNN